MNSLQTLQYQISIQITWNVNGHNKFVEHANTRTNDVLKCCFRNAPAARCRKTPYFINLKRMLYFDMHLAAAM